ncbi:MAG: DUF2723 domain-containing protein [Candidatus Aminicenantes bacterium]|nr:DUF2723 domain-containing protein [Candidatus Aminicenantes bacterium]
MKKEIPGETPAPNNELFGPVTMSVVFLFVFGVYLITLTPTVDFIDSGEFAAVCSTLGIAHPSGYPLFTLLGYGFSFLPIAPTTILRLNIMNALFAAVGILFFVLFLKQLLSIFFPEGAAPSAKKSSTPHKKKKTVEPRWEIPDNTRWLLAAGAGLILAFSFIYWDAATSLEVHSLHALFVSLLLFLLLKFLKAGEKKEETRFAFLLALFLGLSFANHLTTVLLLPGFLFLLILREVDVESPGPSEGADAVRPGSSWAAATARLVRRFLWLVFPFSTGIAFYLYIPIRAQAQPAVMWGNPQSFGDLLDHISGKAFHTQIFSPGGHGEGLGDFFVKSFSRLGFVSIFFILAGAVTFYMLAKKPARTASQRQAHDRQRLFAGKFFYFVILCFLCFTLYAAAFSVVDNIYYYNCSVLFLIIFLPFGLLGFLKKFSIKINHRNIVILTLLLLIPLLAVNYPAANKKNNYFAADFIFNLFSAMEPDAILFASDVHILIHPIYYFQAVEKLRTDIIVLPQHGLRRGWFVSQLKYRFPDLYRKSAAEIDDYDSYFKKEKKDPRLLDQKYYRMLASIIKANYDSRAIYITSEFDPNRNPGFHPGFLRFPEGLAWRLYRAGERIKELPYREFRYRELSYPHKDADAIRHAYMFMLKERGILEATRGRFDLALKWIEQALAVFPDQKLLSDTENGRRILPNRLKDVQKAKQWVISRAAGSASRF